MQIVLPPDIRRKLKTWLRRAGRQEIGGVIMAEQLEPGRFAIRDLSLDETTGSAAHFVRTTAQHATALRDFFQKTGADYSRFNYLGEWHSHPSFAPNPSAVDIASMTDLVSGERDIAFAVLLIVRLRYMFWLEVTATAFVRGRPAVPARVE
jgi:proteasome lid subunit RPN8/RPN11